MMNGIRVSIVAVLLCLTPTFASAQTASADTGGGIGLGLNATTTGGQFGLSVPIDVGTALRIEPGLLFEYRRAEVEGTNGNRQTESSTNFGIRLGIHSFFAQAGPARAFLGADLTYVRFSQSETFEVQVGSVSNTTESDVSGNGFSIVPVIGGEVAVAGGLHIGLRAGPRFAFAFPEIEDDSVESASVFGINGYGRADVIYYF